MQHRGLWARRSASRKNAKRVVAEKELHTDESKVPNRGKGDTKSKSDIKRGRSGNKFMKRIALRNRK